MNKKYYSSPYKIIVAVVIMYILFAVTTIGGKTPYMLKANLFVLIAFGAFALLLVKFSYVAIEDGKLKYVNMLIERHSAPIRNITSIGYPQQAWYTVYSYMYVLYEDPKQPGEDKVMRIIKGQFDDKTLAKIASDLKAINPSIENRP